MRKLLLSLLCISTVAWSYPLSTTEEMLVSAEQVYQIRVRYSKCNQIYRLSENIMQQRQLGISKEEQLAYVDNIDNYPANYPVDIRVIERKMVGMAYMYPQYDEKTREIAVIDFQNKMFLMCDSQKI